MSGSPLVRVRGGPKGVRHIPLDDWKREQKEKKGKLLPAKSPRQQKMEDKSDARRKRQARKKKKASKRKKKP